VDGSVIVWGDNAFGQTNTPGRLSDVVAITAGSGHSLALLTAPADRPFVSIQDAGGAKLNLLLRGIIGRAYAIETATNLAATSGWSTIWSDVLRNSTLSLAWTNVGESSRCSRVSMLVNAEPRVVIHPADGARFDLRLQGVAGGTYTFQTTTNLAANAA
jgi:hypothetical protein